MARTSRATCRAGQAALLGVCAVLLSACERPVYDHRITHPIVVEAVRETITIGVPTEAGPQAASDRDKLSSFLRTYNSRGEGPVEVALGARPVSLSGRDDQEALSALLRRHGVPPGDWVIVDGDAAPGTAVLGYRTYAARVPDCGYRGEAWDTHFKNDQSPNFGCVVQRNIALMATNPKDLIASAKPTPRRGMKAVTVINNYEGVDRSTAEPNLALPQVFTQTFGQ